MILGPWTTKPPGYQVLQHLDILQCLARTIPLSLTKFTNTCNKWINKIFFYLIAISRLPLAFSRFFPCFLNFFKVFKSRHFWVYFFDNNKKIIYMIYFGQIKILLLNMLKMFENPGFLLKASGFSSKLLKFQVFLA